MLFVVNQAKKYKAGYVYDVVYKGTPYVLVF